MGAGFDIDDAAVGAGAGFGDFEDFAFGVDGVAVEGWAGVDNLFVFEVGDCLAGHFGDAHADDEAEDEGAVDEYLTVLVFGHIFFVYVEGVVVHG